MGLGAKPLSKDQIAASGLDQRKMRNMEEGEGGKVSKNFRGIDEVEPRPKRLENGSKVFVISGSHKGCTGIALDVREESILVEVDESRTHITVKRSKVCLLSEKEKLLERGVIKDEASSD